ncbi:hypothetical protein PUN28_019406 [Cardiocondyla obscurior]|uniref:Uncharacterized protein n=1 Tax=Cardiocondyla obscurior TaxID=286306 RepID=A0AAW2EDF8_9HYME
MDIRKFFKKRRLENLETNDHTDQLQNQASSSNLSTSTTSESLSLCVPSNNDNNVIVQPSVVSIQKFDIGHYIEPSLNLSVEEKLQIFENIWVLKKDYNFYKIGEKRRFRYEWLEIYGPWLTYSELDNGAFCKYCAFIIKGFRKYNNFHESARNHVRSEWHKQAVADASSLIAITEKKSLVLPV